MAGTFTAGSLASGAVATGGAAAMYTVPALTILNGYAIRFFNIHATTQTLDIHLKRSGGSFEHFGRFVLDQWQGCIFELPVPLSAGDVLGATTTTATAVYYFVGGVLET